MNKPRLTLVAVAAAISLPLAFQTSIAEGEDTPVKAPTTIAAAAFLEGRWVGDGGKTKTEELWTPAEAGTMFATGRTIAGPKTVFFEFLRIEETKGTLAYIAQPRGGSPTTFMLTSSSDKHVTFENPDHDFPQSIKYELVRLNDTDALQVTLIGDEGNGTKAMNYSLVRGKIKSAE